MVLQHPISTIVRSVILDQVANITDFEPETSVDIIASEYELRAIRIFCAEVGACDLIMGNSFLEKLSDQAARQLQDVIDKHMSKFECDECYTDFGGNNVWVIGETEYKTRLYMEAVTAEYIKDEDGVEFYDLKVSFRFKVKAA